MRVKTAPRQLRRIDNSVVAKQISKDGIEDWLNVEQELSEVQDSLHGRRQDTFSDPKTSLLHSLLVKDCKPNFAETVNEEVLDLSRNPLNMTSSEMLKNTYLYQIMTDPDFLEKIQKDKLRAKYTCSLCKREFENKAELADHRSGGNEQLTCCACLRTFSQQRYLRYHQRCHTDKNKFSCGICTKLYSRLDNLTRHNVLHTNPDKFPCLICTRSFTRKDLLKKHVKCHEKRCLRMSPEK